MLYAFLSLVRWVLLVLKSVIYYFYKSLFYLISLIGVPLYVGGLLLGASTSAAVLFVIIMFFYAYFLYSKKLFMVSSLSKKENQE